MKIKVVCPKCSTPGELEVPDDTWEKVQTRVITGRVVPGKICEHGFRVEFSQAGIVLGYSKLDEKSVEPEIRPVTFTVQTAIRNLSLDVLAALLTAGISEEPIILIGSLAVTIGVRDFMERGLPDTVDVGACVYMVTKEEYETLPTSTKQHMTINLVKKTIANSAFDEDQLTWMQRVLTRANMVTKKDAAEALILKETSKLRTTVSLLRHLAARRGAGLEARENKETD